MENMVLPTGKIHWPGIINYMSHLIPWKGSVKSIKKLLKFLSEAFAEREALEPRHSENIIKLRIIDNHIISIWYSKSNSFWISFTIPNIGCIFGCRISSAPNYEHQTKHHFCIGKPEKERSANRGERTHPYACHICKPTHRIYNRLPDWRSQIGCWQTTGKERMHQ